ncbi:hypothetical protein [Methanocella conradii]|uniref:hypothetical protein n=1 Tax=Methanocella conradii TaxID=1175444 RepID=UPI0024B385D0|nr:hypothetical protein [Methanocella conradii]MDI6897785.1 hypothetical protein [Methanocella conradii]
MAYAREWTYNGTMTTTYQGGSVSMSQTSYGGAGPVLKGDTVSWYNTLYNNVGRQVTGHIGAVTAPPDTQGLVYNDESSTMSAWGSWGAPPNTHKHSATIQYTGPHVILAYHSYQDGNNDYSITNQEMGYT